jgi:hypothetical protein
MAHDNSPRNPIEKFDFPSMRPPDRVAYSHLSLVHGLISNLLFLVPLLGAIGLFAAVRGDAPLWLLAPALLLGVAGWFLTRWYWKREWAAQNLRDDARADELLATADARLPLRQTARRGWQIALTLIFLLFAGIAVLVDFAPRAMLVAAGVGVASAAAWIFAPRRKDIGAICASGIEIGDTLIGWNAIASMNAELRLRNTTARMRISLVNPELARKVAASPGVSSDDSSAAEILLSIDGAGETPAVRYQVAQMLWSRARNDLARAAGQRKAAQMHEHLAAHPEDAEEFARRAKEEFESEIARARASLDALDARARTLRSSNYRRPGATPLLPAWKQWTIVGVMVVAAAACVFGFSAPLYKSPEWQDLSPFVVLGLAATISAWVLVVLLPRAEKKARTTVALGIPMLILGMCWPIAMYALPDLYTRAMGQKFEQVAPMQREYISSDRKCKRRIHGGPFASGGPSPYYCAGISEFDRLPDEGLMRVSGRQSWFGTHIDRVDPAK